MSCDPYSTTVSRGLSHSHVVLVGDPTGRNGFQKLEALYLWRYLLGQWEQYSCHKLFCKWGCSHHCWAHFLPFTSYSHWLPDFRALHIGEGTSPMPTLPKPEETPSPSPWSSSTAFTANLRVEKRWSTDFQSLAIPSLGGPQRFKP